MSSKQFLWPRAKRLLPIFSCRILMVSCLTLGLSSILNYFCVLCKKLAQVHFSACCYPVFPAPRAEETVFIPLILFPALSKVSWPYICGFISGFSILFYCLSVCSCASTILSWWLQLCSNRLKSGIVMPPALFFFFKITLAIRGLFWLQDRKSVV